MLDRRTLLGRLFGGAAWLIGCRQQPAVELAKKAIDTAPDPAPWTPWSVKKCHVFVRVPKYLIQEGIESKIVARVACEVNAAIRDQTWKNPAKIWPVPVMTSEQETQFLTLTAKVDEAFLADTNPDRDDQLRWLFRETIDDFLDQRHRKLVDFTRPILVDGLVREIYFVRSIVVDRANRVRFDTNDHPAQTLAERHLKICEAMGIDPAEVGGLPGVGGLDQSIERYPHLTVELRQLPGVDFPGTAAEFHRFTWEWAAKSGEPVPAFMADTDRHAYHRATMIKPVA